MDNGRKDSNTIRCDIHTQVSNANLAEKELLRAILKEYSLVTRIREELEAEDFSPGPWREIYELMLRQQGPFAGAEMLEQVPEETRSLLLELLATAENELGPPLRAEALPKCIQRVKAAAIKRRLLAIQAEIAALRGNEDQAQLLADYQRQQVALLRQLDACQDRSGFAGAF